MNSPMFQDNALSVSPDTSHESMSDEVFRAFQRIAMETTGIELADGKRAMIVNRFSRRLHALNLTCFEEYLSLVSQADHPEAREFVDTVTTNLTYFFREPHHFKALSDNVLQQLAARKPISTPIRIWSAGCSSGAEPYTIAMVVKETAVTESRQVRILCTDIDTKMVEATHQGSYSSDQMRGLDDAQMQKWFSKTASGRYLADEQLRSMLLCRQLNLFDRWPIKPDVDVIMCRNVLIYFNAAYQKTLLEKFAKHQSKGGFLFLGHSESLEGMKSTYKRIDNTVYERL